MVPVGARSVACGVCTDVSFAASQLLREGRPFHRTTQLNLPSIFAVSRIGPEKFRRAQSCSNSVPNMIAIPAAINTCTAVLTVLRQERARLRRLALRCETSP